MGFIINDRTFFCNVTEKDMEYIETGEIVTVFGIRGEVKVYPWADYPGFLEEFDTFYLSEGKKGYVRMKAENVRVQKNMVIIKFAGTDTVEAARGLVGRTVYLDRDEIELEDGTYFVVDLIGCEVIEDSTGKSLGRVESVDNYGANDVYTVKDGNGKEFLFPAVDEFIVSTDIEEKKIRVRIIEGMLDED